VFGAGHAVPLDRNAKAGVAAYARAWDHQHARPGQRSGALDRSVPALAGLAKRLEVVNDGPRSLAVPERQYADARDVP
jgi:hypothetical protein